MTSGVVLLAGGFGQRMGRRVPKQFLSLNGQPLFVQSLKVFLRRPTVHEIVIVTLRQKIPTVKKILARIKTKKFLHVVESGSFRGLSVRNGVRALIKKVDVVLIHDSARALVTADIVRRVEEASAKTGVALAAWPLGDTLKFSSRGLVRKTIPRQDLWLAQTPQGFRRSIALKCLLKPSRHATDDVALAEKKGFPVKIVEGSAINMKVTYPSDLKLCRILSR